jgi:hypothetical protein
MRPDGNLALGERYERRDADGTVLFAITVVDVDTDLTCTGPDSLPAENGHLIALHVQVLGGPVATADPQASTTDGAPAEQDPPPADGGPPPFSAADFRFVGADDVRTADVDTGSSAACLPEATAWPAGRPGPDRQAEGVVVLDVPAGPGTVVYRPASWSSGLRWQV